MARRHSRRTVERLRHSAFSLDDDGAPLGRLAAPDQDDAGAVGSPESEVVARVERAEAIALVRRVMAGLPPDYATVLEARFMAGKSVAQLAAELGIKEGLVKWRTHRAKELFLKDCLRMQALGAELGRAAGLKRKARSQKEEETKS